MHNAGSTAARSAPPRMVSSGNLTEVHDALVDLAHSVCAVDIRTFEGKSANEIRANLAPLAVSLLEQSLVQTRLLFSLCDQWGQETNPKLSAPLDESIDRDFDFEVDKLVFDKGSHHNPREHVADIAFIAKSELKDRLQRLRAVINEEDPWHLLSEIDSALRRIRKSLAAVEYVLCDSENLPRRLDFQTELDVSLVVRRTYIRFRRNLTGSQAPTEETIYKRLRIAGTQIAVLIGRDVYPQLRVRDRAQLREMQNRILDWLRSHKDDTRNGMRIWQDLIGVVDIFCQVSRRQELVEHDASMVEAIYNSIENQCGGALSDQVLELLQAIEGVDPEIDLLLADDRKRMPGLWKDSIKRLMLHFGRLEPEPSATISLLDDGDFF